MDLIFSNFVGKQRSCERRIPHFFGWPQALVDKALRALSSVGALARKEIDWPLPLTSTFPGLGFRQVFLGAVGVGESGAGKSPLGRSVLMAQHRRNKQLFQCHRRPCVRGTPELDFLTGLVTIGDFLDDPTSLELSIKALQSLLDAGFHESMCWARWGAVKWVQNQTRAPSQQTPMTRT